ncbi:MAG: hypothetical protein Q4P06_07755 [Actinomycetaceae bacterium]|nr:hypothetical protein [Actinomycetaceae bacterium]
MNATELASELQLAADIAFVDGLYAKGVISPQAHAQILNQVVALSTAPIGVLVWRVRLDKNRV